MGVTAADDRDNGSNGEEDRIDDDGGGDDWGEVDVDNDGNGVASLFPCLPPIIVKFDGDRNGGEGRGGGLAGLLLGIDKKDDDSNMNARKRATNRSKTTGAGRGAIYIGLSVYYFFHFIKSKTVE